MRTGYLDRASGQWVDTAPAHDFPEPQPEPEAPAAAPRGGPAVSTLAQRAAAIKVLRHPNATPGDIADARQTLLGFSPRQVQVSDDGLVRPMPGPAPAPVEAMPPPAPPIAPGAPPAPDMPAVDVGDDGLVRPTPPAPDPTSMTKGQKAQMLLAARQKNIGVN